MCAYVCVCLMCAGTHESKKKKEEGIRFSLKLELQVVVSCLKLCWERVPETQ